jgi:hypothetical protein
MMKIKKVWKFYKTTQKHKSWIWTKRFLCKAKDRNVTEKHKMIMENLRQHYLGTPWQ